MKKIPRKDQQLFEVFTSAKNYSIFYEMSNSLSELIAERENKSPFQICFVVFLNITINVY